MANSRLTERNTAIAAMFVDGEQLKNFYRFTAQNPHINLRDACQIILERPNATVCYTFSEWSAMDRRVTKGRKGIAYYDTDGYKQFVFDASDTHGDTRYTRPILPMKRLLGGLDVLNGTQLSDDERSDYRKIHNGVHAYLQTQDELTGDEERDKLLIEGISYSLYSKTGFPKSTGIKLSGLPYSFAENAEFVKEVYIRADMLVHDIEEAFQNKPKEVKVIDDTEEETVSDEPVISVEQTENIPEEHSEAKEQPTINPLYQRYLDAQNLNPQAVVILRLGDFYEIMGENAKVISEELDLTLTGREVGLPERVPMCGMPYHAMDKYLDKILETHGVIVVEGDEEPKYILSHAEVLAQTTKAKENPKIKITEIADDEPNPFDDEQPKTDDDWRNELADELGDLDDEPLDEDVEEAENDEGEELDETDSDSDEQDEEVETEQEDEPKVKEKKESTQKKPEKGIKDRKRINKPQLTLFDLSEPQEKSREEQLIEHELKRGSHMQHGKFRIFDKYNENPSEKVFADFLKKEYGIGGSYAGNINESHDGKGIHLRWIDREQPENNLDVKLKWSEVAVRIADLIDDDNYLSEQEKKEYVAYKVEQNRLRELRAEEERRKNELIDKVIYSANHDRKQRILDEYANTTKLVAFSEFLKNEYGTNEELGDGYFAIYNAQGIWLRKGEKSYDYQDRIYLNWNEFADKVCNLIENDRYIEQIQPQETEQPRDLDAEEDEDWDALIDANILNRVEPIPAFNRFKELTAEGKAFFDSYQQRFLREPTDSLWDEVQNCRTIANGIYEVSTAGHGGIMIAAELAPYILSLEALKKGVSDKGYLCYEEDCDAAIPLRELYDKGILTQTNDYFTHYYVRSDRPEAENGRIKGSVPFDVATEEEKAKFFEWWNNAIIGSLVDWNGEYWETHRKAEVSESLEANPEQEKIKSIVDRIVKEGTENTSEGNWIVYFDEFKDDEQFVREHQEEIADALSTREEVAEITIENEGFDTTYYLDFCPNYEWKEGERDDDGKTENTDLSGVLDQSVLGGAKTRFRNNVAAIRLVNKLYVENRNPTEAEKKVLSQFVGWGGLSQAFDENNPQWKKEYAELKGLLSQEDYEQARGSMLNAYYTAKDVIGGIYSALDRFGVKGNNRILEPSMGTGNFFGFMPKEIAEGAKLYGVELDNLTGRIAAKLYPQANVQIKGFEDTSFPNDKFDIVVGNVPFGGYGVSDSDYNRYNFRVHDYFLAKSIDKVKPNGIVAIVTSKGTMDKLNPSARKYVAERAELLGAVRLPNTAFKQTAGTEAVADILFFRKREERTTDISDVEWLGTGKTEEEYEINNYFIKHPEMVLGTLAEETGLYGGVDVTVKPDGRELSEAIAEAVKNLPSDFYANPETSPEEESTTEVDYNVKPMCYKAESGRLYMRVGDEMQEQAIPKFPKDAYQRIQRMIELREELHHILDIQIQGCSDEVLEQEQRKLNAQYDLFVKRYGELNNQTNIRLFKEDGDSALLLACEEVDEETKKVSKSDIFFKRTIRPYIVPTSTDDCFEALQISKNERGRVDISYIEELTGKSYDDVLFELGDAVFRDPEITDRADRYSGFVTSEEYLSGKVVAKLNVARHYAEEYPEYRKNVAALEKVQPTPLTASEISVRLGQTWLDKEYYKQFYCELVGVHWWKYGDVELFYNPHDSSWRLDQKDNIRYETQMKQKEVYGTKRAPAYRLFMDCMNLKATTIYDTVLDENGRETRVLNQAETIAAREKQNKIKEEFANWIFAKPERREELEATYNRLFNQIRLPSYDGSYLRFPEMNPAIELRPHQKNAIHRIITSNQSTLLHHVVGSGKTYTMAASIMKMRQLGLCKKAMMAVPNHLVQQWASEWRKLYPNAKILVATKEDLEKDNRQKFVSKVAMGDWDGIIIAQSSFAKIPVSTERQIRKLNEEIESVELTIANQWAEHGMPRGAVKNLERIKKTKQAQLKKLMDDSKKDSVLTFENLGVDFLYIDEAHYYKNLFMFTKMNNVAGISNAASQRASDLKLKCEYLQELHGSDKGVVFATGTPISNSMAEMYTMQSYLQPTALKESGIEFFDGWAADFGETITSMELAPSGQGYKARTRFAKFTNLPELLTMYRSFADVQTADMVKLDVPEAQRHVINLKPSDTVIELAEKIAERAEMIHSGSVKPEEDNMLKVTSDGKKLALDPRCFVPSSLDEEGSKLNVCADYINEVYQDTASLRGTQLVFCDLSTPKKKFEDYIYGLDFDAYNDLKYKLVQRGIPADEIAFIHGANTDEQKQALFDKVNSGAVRVLIGSTEKCGAGTNVQKRLAALHHLDTPYRPSDLEQRIGRGIRQGNIFNVVKIFTYVKERTFDSYSYQILENKQKFIAQINRGDLTVREAEDIDETTLNYAEIKAITAANPRIKRKMEVDTEIARLRILEGQYRKNLYALQDKIRKDFPESIRQQELLIERTALDLMHLNSSKPTNPEAFEISVNGKNYTDRKEGGKALTDALYASKPETVVAEYCGFKISMNPMTSLMGERDVTLTGHGQYAMGIGESASGNLQRLDNFIEDFPKRKERLENRLKQLKDDLAVAEEQVEKPFEHREHLSELLSEQAELNAELNLDKKEEVIIADENDSDDGHYRMMPTQEMKEVKIIDEEDKIAAMNVGLFPDYGVTQEDMHGYGYKWDGMLPMQKDTAEMLLKMGVPIRVLNENDTDNPAPDLAAIEAHKGLFGVEKPEWFAWLETDKAREYYSAKHALCLAATEGVASDMRDVERKHLIKFVVSNASEREAIGDYLREKQTVSSVEQMKPYLGDLLDNFTNRIGGDFLGNYGWEIDDVTLMLIDYLHPEELRFAAKQARADERFSGVGMPQDMNAKQEPEAPINAEINYEIEVKNSLIAEYDEFKAELTKRSPEEVFEKNYQIGAYNSFSSVIENMEAYFTEDDYKALYEERGAILGNLYDEFLDTDGFSVEDYDETVEFIKDYCQCFHSEIYYRKPIYFQTAHYANEHEEMEQYRSSHEISGNCKREIDESIRSNFDGMHLNAGFEDSLIEKYGRERVAYIVATTIQEHDYDGRYSRENKEWAKTIPISESEDERRHCCLNVHPAVLDGFADMLRKKIKEEENKKMAEEKYLHFTARGDKVLSITKDRDDRNIAIVQREKIGDFVVAAGYNTSDGTWKAGKYELSTLEEAEQYRTKKYGFENGADTIEKKWLTCKVSTEAHIKRFQFNTLFRMPKGSGYEGYAYSVFNDRIKEGTITTDLKSDTRVRAYVIQIPSNKKVELKKGDETVGLDPHEFISLVNGTLADKYEREQRYTVAFPPEAFIKEYDNAILVAMPNDSKYKGYVYYLPASVVKEDRNRDDGTLIANIGESFKITLRKGEEKVEITAKEYAEIVGDKGAEHYKRASSEMDEYREQNEGEKRWETVAVSESAVIANYKDSTLFKMPKGDYEGYVYYMPSGMVRKEDDGLYLRIPEDFVAHLKDGDDKKDLTAQEFIAAIEGKTEEDYENLYRRPSEEARKQFEKVEENLRKNVPEEMRKKPNWVIVRTRENEATGRLDKFLIDVHTGKFAESDNPETWTDFDTACKYAKENGGVALAYALDGKDGIACIDLDGCMAENGDFSETAQQAFMAANGSYAEKSVSGKGLHIFGKTKGADLRSFSKDKTMEYYQGGHFITMTGDNYGSSELKSFDTPIMTSVLESKLEKRVAWENTGKGTAGLSSMDDREMLEKAFGAKNGETVKRLYNGEDLRGNHSNSDMSLMNYLAFWSNHDIDQMLRVFSTSGLYRPEKPQSYYEYTAIKAVKGTPCYTPPKASTNAPKSNSDANSK